MRLLVGFRYGPDLGQDALVVDAAAVPAGHFVSGPKDVARRYLPVLAMMAEGRVGPRLHDDIEVLFVEFLLEFLVSFGIGLIVRESLIVLAQRVDPPRLVAARESGKCSALGHLVENRNVLGDADRILAWQNQSKLPDPDMLSLHPEKHVEHDRVGRNLFTFYMEVMFC